MPPLAAVPVMTFMASAIIEPTSPALAGRMSVLVVLASSPNWAMYCSATRSWTASNRPRSASRQPRAAAPLPWPSPRQDGSSLTFGFVDLLLLARFRALIVSCLEPSAALMTASREPSEVRMTALLAFGAHLLFHRRQDIVRRRDVLDLVTQDLHAPGLTLYRAR